MIDIKAQAVISGFADEYSPSFSEQLSALDRLGVSHIELRGIDGINVSDLTGGKLREVKEGLSSAGIAVSSIGSPIGKIDIKDDFPRHMDKLKRTLEIQKELSAPYIRIFSFYLPKGADPAEYRAVRISGPCLTLQTSWRWASPLWRPLRFWSRT